MVHGFRCHFDDTGGVTPHPQLEKDMDSMDQALEDLPSPRPENLASPPWHPTTASNDHPDADESHRMQILEAGFQV